MVTCRQFVPDNWSVSDICEDISLMRRSAGRANQLLFISHWGRIYMFLDY